MARHAGTNNDLLAMALIGYEAEITKINSAIAEIRARLGEQAVGGDGQPASKKRTMSAAGRRRIAAAQRKRWAAVKKSQSQGKSAVKPPAPKKRKLSAAARKRIGEATRKRWAAQRKAGARKAGAGAKAAQKAAAS
jgi:hypothetical protein